MKISFSGFFLRKGKMKLCKFEFPFVDDVLRFFSPEGGMLFLLQIVGIANKNFISYVKRFVKYVKYPTFAESN